MTFSVGRSPAPGLPRRGARRRGAHLGAVGSRSQRSGSAFGASDRGVWVLGDQRRMRGLQEFRGHGEACCAGPGSRTTAQALRALDSPHWPSESGAIPPNRPTSTPCRMSDAPGWPQEPSLGAFLASSWSSACTASLPGSWEPVVHSRGPVLVHSSPIHNTPQLANRGRYMVLFWFAADLRSCQPAFHPEPVNHIPPLATP